MRDLLLSEAGVLYDALPGPLCITDARGNILFINRAWRAALNGGKATRPNLAITDLFHPEDQVTWQHHWEQAALSGGFTGRFQVWQAEGRSCWYQLQVCRAAGREGERGSWLVSACDVDEQVRREHDLRREVSELQGMVDASAECIKLLDLDARLLSMNQGGMQVMEVEDFDACRNLLWSSFWQGEVGVTIEHALQEARAGRTFTFEGQAATMKGTLKWWEVRVSPIYDQQGRIYRLLAISRDISLRKDAEKTRQESEMRLRSLIEASPISITTTSAGGTVTEANPATLALTGWTPEDLKAERASWHRQTLPEYADLDRSATEQALRAGRSEPYEKEILGAGGVRVPVRVVLARGEASEPQRFIWYIQDLRPQKAAERALSELNTELECRVHQRTAELEERTVALDAFARFTDAVGTETDVLALARGALSVIQARFVDATGVYYERKGETWQARVWTSDLAEDTRKVITQGIPVDAPVFAEPLRRRSPWFVDHWNARREGIDHTEQYHAAANLPLLLNNEVRGFLAVGLRHTGTWSDTDRAMVQAIARGLNLALERTEHARQLELQRRELQEQTRELQGANEELEAFAYSVSHDLRAPVRHIAGYTALIHKSLGERLDPKTARYLSVVDQSATRMNTLIDAMLDLARTSRVPLRMESVDLDALVSRVRRELAPDHESRSVQWNVSPLPQVHGDQGTLYQVMVNLISNALKYSRTREVSRIDVWSEEHEHGWAIFVRDNGVGFDPRYGDKLFGVFQRLHRQEEFEGTGVGLANVRRIVHRHGGQVWAEGRPGEGATIGFTLSRTS
ncbi:PAS domain-containing protein [Deinococcus peraridilitoris]|uniref:histidine kinase n=1 Tax=Deinococcus peraridilitoris (strain DSM 19664 / LMG 22246 / CIP 109416 / KR-200) TaxID=937777 RepID=K9ZYR6_DEIPD|nr:PAS domain-containing protein [Deinococcus peraridilitoris]AFZ65900.1 bacteriophytochrome (light-regulated signal transduction histidine kinase) [Deinococcus peraridilitoris DSM 19664]